MSQRRVLRIAIHILTMAMAAILWGWADRAQAIQYELVDGGGGDQGGHTLSGFIEFNSPCGGECSAANITDFAFSVTGASAYSYSYQSPEDVFLFQAEFQIFLSATLDNLLIDYHRAGNFALGNSAEGSPYIRWDSPLSPSYKSAGPNQIGGWGASIYPPFVVVIGVVVPEPATIATVFWGSVVSFLVARNRELGITKNEGVANHVSY